MAFKLCSCDVPTKVCGRYWPNLSKFLGSYGTYPQFPGSVLRSISLGDSSFVLELFHPLTCFFHYPNILSTQMMLKHFIGRQMVSLSSGIGDVIPMASGKRSPEESMQCQRLWSTK